MVLPERCYYVECPDSGIRLQVTMTATWTEQVLPPQLDMPCISVSCESGHHVLLPINRKDADELMDEDR